MTRQCFPPRRFLRLRSDRECAEADPPPLEADVALLGQEPQVVQGELAAGPRSWSHASACKRILF